jgi:REP element-mobilizing transposase RayT
MKNRRSIRLKEYDYSQSGAYFVTICTHNKECLFGEIVDGKMILNDAGKIVQTVWYEISEHVDHVELDQFVIMPNHIHGIIVLHDGCRDTACCAPTVERFGKLITGSLPTIIRSFKSAITKRINELHETPGQKIWQRNYYERVIRNENELNQVRQYIVDNPAKWDSDEENPNAKPPQPR